MKLSLSSKKTPIRHKSELVHHFHRLLPEDADLRWTIAEKKENELSEILELKLDKRQLEFVPVYELNPSFPWLKHLETKTGKPPLLVTPELSNRVLEFCKQNGIAAVDLNGRAWLRAPGLLVDRAPLPTRKFRYEVEPRNIFVGKSVRIVRALLTNRDHLWTQAELVERTKASSGLVSRIVQYLIAQGFVEKTNSRELKVIDFFGLVDEWSQKDQFSRRVSTSQYSVLSADPAETARSLAQWAAKENISFALTQWIAGWLRHPYTAPVITSAYVARLPDANALEQLGWRPVNGGGGVWLHVPEEEGVFLETTKTSEFTLVSDAQIFVDLKKTGLRGPDQAEALRNWEGFCRQ